MYNLHSSNSIIGGEPSDGNGSLLAKENRYPLIFLNQNFPIARVSILLSRKAQGKAMTGRTKTSTIARAVGIARRALVRA
jgi:hypothetical protein